MGRGPQVLSHEIEITDIDNTNAHLFGLAEDQYGRLVWDQGSVPAEDAEPGEELIKTWDYFGGGMGETYDIEERIGFKTGAYYFSQNCQLTDPYRIRPRQALTSVTLTNNASPVTHFFEATDANAADKYIYCEAAAKIFKVNSAGTLKETLACNTNTVCGQPAEWNSIWEVPQGDNEDRRALTTVNDEVNNSGGDDAWTFRSTGEARVQHFTIVENEIIAARSNRIVSKCSATDTDVDGNWTGDYNVGPPGTIVNSLVNIGGECGVGAQDGFYLWDTVSTSRQQLPLLAGLSDADNAKGMTVVGNLVLIGTADGAWRWVAGSAAQFGPDAIRNYVEVKGPTNIPIKMQHYGWAFLGTYLYNACFDGTKHHIIYTRLDPNRPTLLGAKWEFLLTTDAACLLRELYIDTERRLWLSYGNNVAYFTLSRGGAPTGGNWGTAASSGWLYFPITKMGTEALKRLRLVEIVTENIPANLNVTCSVYRDGAAQEPFGVAITSDGVGECFWTPGTDDTAREIQLQTQYNAASGFSASTTAPGIKRVTLHAEALEEDADLIVCTVKLGENAKEQKAIIDRLKKAGAVKLTNALSGVKETVVLYRRRYYSLEQRGNEPPIAACELRFRRSDTS